MHSDNIQPDELIDTGWEEASCKEVRTHRLLINPRPRGQLNPFGKWFNNSGQEAMATDGPIAREICSDWRNVSVWVYTARRGFSYGALTFVN